MGAILQDFREKIKGALADQSTYTSLVLILVALASFGLGRQSLEVKEPIPLTPTVLAEEDSAPSPEKDENGLYVASKNGKAYHLPHCSGAKSISEANKITFKSKAEAEAAGYRPAANCKGI